MLLPRTPAFRRCARLLATAALIGTIGTAHSAAVSEGDLILTLEKGGKEAESAARWLGGMESAKGLRAAIVTGNEELVDYYLRGFPSDYSYPAPEFPYVDDHLNPELEKIVLQTLDDPRISPAMKDEVLRLARERKYQTRALFDSLLRLTNSPEWRLKGAAVGTITHTDLAGIEQPVLDLYLRLDADGKNSLSSFFKERRYLPALPAIKSSIVSRKPRVGARYDVMASFETPEAIAFLIEELEQYHGTTLTPGSKSLLVLLVSNLASILPETPLPTQQIIARMPHKQEQHVAEAYIRLIEVRHEEAGIDDLLNYLSDDFKRHKALQALLAMDTPEAWTRIRSGLKRQLDEKRIPESQYLHADRGFKERLGDPEKYRQQQADIHRRTEVNRRIDVLEQQYGDKLRALKERDPAKHREALAMYQKMGESVLAEIAKEPANRALAAERFIQIARQRERDADQLRFIDRKPLEAVRLMEEARSLHRQYGDDEIDVIVWLADAYRFDLNDKQKALTLYREALDTATREEITDNFQAMIIHGLKYWLPHEIRFLETGKSFSGAVGYDEVATVSKLALIGLNAPGPWGNRKNHRFLSVVWEQPDQDRPVKLHLERAPLSQLMIADATSLLAAEADAQKVIRFLEKRDPARYLSTAMLATFDYGGKDRWTSEMKEQFTDAIRESRGWLSDHSAVLTDASEQFRKKNSVRFVPYSDTSMADPQRSWRLLLTALREQDLDTVLSCFTDEAAAQARTLLLATSPQEWLHFATNLVAITPAGGNDSSQAFTVTRYLEPKNGPRKPDRSTQVVFVRRDGRWKATTTDFLSPMREIKKAASSATGR